MTLSSLDTRRHPDFLVLGLLSALIDFLVVRLAHFNLNDVFSTQLERFGLPSKELISK